MLYKGINFQSIDTYLNAIYEHHDTPTISWSTFRKRYYKYQKDTGNKPSVDELESFLSEQETIGIYGYLRNIYNSIPNPSMTWYGFRKKYYGFKEKNNRNPTDKELLDFLIPEQAFTFQKIEYRSVRKYLQAIWADAEEPKLSIHMFRKKYFVKKKQLGKMPTLPQLKKLLKPENSVDYKYKDKIYHNHKDLYEAMPDKGVRREDYGTRIKEWQQRNKKTKLTDEILEKIAAGDKRRGVLKNIWEKIQDPKIGYSAFSEKYYKEKKRLGRAPNQIEIEAMANWPTWVDLSKDTDLLDIGNRCPSIEGLWNKLGGKKISLSKFSRRVGAELKHTSPLSFIRVCELAEPYVPKGKINGYIYRFTQKSTGKVYIGLTTQPPEVRKRRHIYDATYFNKKDFNKDGLHFAILMGGVDDFIFKILSRHQTIAALQNAEIKQIKAHKSFCPNGFNLEKGGGGVPIYEMPIEYDGEFYWNLSALAADKAPKGVTPRIVRIRILEGWPIEDALTLPVLPRGITRHNAVFRKYHKTLRQLAKESNLKFTTVRSRVSKGWTIEEALEWIAR